MQKVNFDHNEQDCFTLVESDALLAVRTFSSTVSPAIDAAVGDSNVLLSLDDANVRVFELPESGPHLEARKQALRQFPNVRFAGSVLVSPETGEPVLYTDNIFIKFLDSIAPGTCQDVMRDEGFVVKREIAYAKNAWFVTHATKTGKKIFEHALAVLQRPEVEFCHPELITPRINRAIHPNQWHLKKTVVTYQVAVDASANVESAHQLSQGAGTIIAVIDDGFDIDHPEFSGKGKVVASRNLDRSTLNKNPRPKAPHHNHGTAAAGVACANGSNGASGVAPKAALMPIKINSHLGSQAEAEAFYWAAEHGAHVISCSWGGAEGHWANPADPLHAKKTRMPASTRLAIDFAATKGRDGKGCLIFFAAGNGNEPVENDQYASYKNVIAVAACNDRGRRSIYSDFGPAIWCCFPSNDFWHPDPAFSQSSVAPLTRGVWTTDVRGQQGYNDGTQTDPWGNYTEMFGGSSSACPGAAGVAALVLSANPALTALEVRNILALSSDKIGSPEDAKEGHYDQSGHSHFYGHGRLNARNAVEMALAYQQTSVEKDALASESEDSSQ